MSEIRLHVQSEINLMNKSNLAQEPLNVKGED